jgi:hypothetical protein
MIVSVVSQRKLLSLSCLTLQNNDGFFVTMSNQQLPVCLGSSNLEESHLAQCALRRHQGYDCECCLPEQAVVSLMF